MEKRNHGQLIPDDSYAKKIIKDPSLATGQLLFLIAIGHYAH